MVEVVKKRYKDNEVIEVKKEDCLNLSFEDN